MVKAGVKLRLPRPQEALVRAPTVANANEVRDRLGIVLAVRA